MAQITPITSEALQEAIRRLLPSQVGFGEDLQASNVIMPIIDLTPTAEGSTLPSNLQTALAFGSQTAFDVENTTSTIINTTGFWRVFGVSTIDYVTTSGRTTKFTMSDGFTTKDIWEMGVTLGAGTANHNAVAFDFTVFLKAGDSLGAVCSSASRLAGSYRQIADINGNLVNPSGFVVS